MRLSDCYNFHDFRKLAQRRLPGPIFNYIDGAADDETTFARIPRASSAAHLVPNVLRGVQNIDMSVTVMGQKLADADVLFADRAATAGSTTPASARWQPRRQNSARCLAYPRSAR